MNVGLMLVYMTADWEKICREQIFREQNKQQLGLDGDSDVHDKMVSTERTRLMASENGVWIANSYFSWPICTLNRDTLIEIMMLRFWQLLIDAVESTSRQRLLSLGFQADVLMTSEWLCLYCNLRVAIVPITATTTPMLIMAQPSYPPEDLAHSGVVKSVLQCTFGGEKPLV